MMEPNKKHCAVSNSQKISKEFFFSIAPKKTKLSKNLCYQKMSIIKNVPLNSYSTMKHQKVSDVF